MTTDRQADPSAIRPPNRPPNRLISAIPPFAGASRQRATPDLDPSPPEPLPALRGGRFRFGGGPGGGGRGALGGLNAYVGGSGPPLVLVHSINAAASAAEMRPIFEHASAGRTVFAIDLPGFGLSERSDRRYDPRLMTDALHALAEQVRQRCGAVPIDAVAASLGCEFLARAAAEQPMRWGRLAFVSPTGLAGTTPRRGAPGSTRFQPWLHALLSKPVWSPALYGWLTRPGVIRYFLQRTWGSKDIDETLWAYDVVLARQPGARFAPLHFLAGGLFSQDIHSVYQALARPVWMSHGVRGDFKDFRGKQLIHDRGNWQTTVYPTGALPYFEMPSAFFLELDAFLADQRVDRTVKMPARARPEVVQA